LKTQVGVAVGGGVGVAVGGGVGVAEGISEEVRVIVPIGFIVGVRDGLGSAIVATSVVSTTTVFDLFDLHPIIKTEDKTRKMIHRNISEFFIWTHF